MASSPRLNTMSVTNSEIYVAKLENDPAMISGVQMRQFLYVVKD